MRRFIFVSHTAPPTGEWNPNDLPGSGGRIDVLCRNLQSVFFLSHGLREDCEATLVFAANPLKPRAVRVSGRDIQMFNPDERSTAARIQQALNASGNAPIWKKVQRGLDVAAVDLATVVDEVRGQGTLLLLDPQGEEAATVMWPKDPIFLLSDHTPFTKDEYAVLEKAGARRVSLGPHWYHGNHAVAVVQWLMDRSLSYGAGTAAASVGGVGGMK